MLYNCEIFGVHRYIYTHVFGIATIATSTPPEIEHFQTST